MGFQFTILFRFSTLSLSFSIGGTIKFGGKPIDSGKTFNFNIYILLYIPNAYEIVKFYKTTGGL